MRTMEVMLAKLRDVEDDERLYYPTATIDVDAPLALIQLQLKTQQTTLRWALGDDAPPVPERLRRGK